MSEIRGEDIVIYVNTGTDQIPVWTPVGGQTGAKLKETNDVNESKGYKLSPAGAAKKYSYGQYSWTVSCDGIVVKDDEGLAALKAAARSQQMVKVRVKEEDAYIQEGLCLITSIDQDAPYEDDSTYAVELQGTGTLTPNPA